MTKTEWDELWDDSSANTKGWMAVRDWYLGDWAKRVKAVGDKQQAENRDWRVAHSHLQQKLEAIRGLVTDPVAKYQGVHLMIKRVLEVLGE